LRNSRKYISGEKIGLQLETSQNYSANFQILATKSRNLKLHRDLGTEAHFFFSPPPDLSTKGNKQKNLITNNLQGNKQNIN
jgi:hypothetical protein